MPGFVFKIFNRGVNIGSSEHILPIIPFVDKPLVAAEGHYLLSSSRPADSVNSTSPLMASSGAFLSTGSGLQTQKVFSALPCRSSTHHFNIQQQGI
jgi:hypothetical protein